MSAAKRLEQTELTGESGAAPGPDPRPDAATSGPTTSAAQGNGVNDSALLDAIRNALLTTESEDADGYKLEGALTAVEELRGRHEAREADPWPVIEWLQENMPRALELCPYKVKR